MLSLTPIPLRLFSSLLDMHISLSYNSSAALKSKQLEGIISNKLERDVRKSNKMFENGSQIQHQGHRPVQYVERSLAVFEVWNLKQLEILIINIYNNSVSENLTTG